MKILEEMWFGNIKPNERKLPSNSEHYELVRSIVGYEEALFTVLSEQAKEIYDKLRECHSELSSLVECEAFVEGFRLGSKIMLEVMEVDADE